MNREGAKYAKEEGSSATDYVTDVTDRRKRKKQEVSDYWLLVIG